MVAPDDKTPAAAESSCDRQEIRHSCPRGAAGVEAPPMGLTHCPLCIGLALLSAGRFMAHLVMASQLMPPAQNAITP